MQAYGRKFHVKFVNGDEKTYDAKELEFFKDKFAKGGEVNADNVQMLRSNAKTIRHHSKELEAELKSNPRIEAWVVAKGERAATDLSDITHYLDGKKMAGGGQIDWGADLGDGITVGTDIYITDPKSLFKGATGFISGAMGNDLIVTILENGNERNVLVSKKGYDKLDAPEFAKGGYMAAGGRITKGKQYRMNYTKDGQKGFDLLEVVDTKSSSNRYQGGTVILMKVIDSSDKSRIGKTDEFGKGTIDSSLKNNLMFEVKKPTKDDPFPEFGSGGRLRFEAGGIMEHNHTFHVKISSEEEPQVMHGDSEEDVRERMAEDLDDGVEIISVRRVDNQAFAAGGIIIQEDANGKSAWITSNGQRFLAEWAGDKPKKGDVLFTTKSFNLVDEKSKTYSDLYLQLLKEIKQKGTLTITTTEVVVVAKAAAKDGGKVEKFRFAVATTDEKEAKENAFKLWQADYGNSDLSIVEVLTDAEYREKYLSKNVDPFPEFKKGGRVSKYRKVK